MTEHEALNILPCILSMQTALICFLAIVKLRQRRESQLGNGAILTIMQAYAMSVLAWLSVVFYIAIPNFYVVLCGAILWNLLTVNVMYYKFIFEITKTNENEKFSLMHFCLPTLLALMMCVCSLYVPFEVKMQLVDLNAEYAQDNLYYSMLFAAIKPLFFIFALVYCVLGLQRIIRFSKVVINYSADEQRTSLRWLYHILFVLFGAFLIGLVLTFILKQKLTSFPMILLPAAVFLFKDAVIVYNVLLDNFVIIKNEQGEIEDKIDSNWIDPEVVKRLELYMRKSRPYLNPKLKITDLAYALNTNRSELSFLINRTYGMNFCRFVNRFRLDEFERLRVDSANRHLTELELVAKAGFSEWRGYVRVRNRERMFNYKAI